MCNGLESIVDSSRIQEVLQQKDQQIVALQGELFVLKEQLDWLKRQIFGSKSERIVADLESQPLLPALELDPAKQIHKLLPDNWLAARQNAL